MMKLTAKAAKYYQSVLLGLSVLFLISLTLELSRDSSLQSESDALTSAMIATETGQTGQITNLPPLEEFAAIIERPLFAMDRRPERPDLAETGEPDPLPTLPNPAANAGELLLSGIVLVDDEQIALVQTASDNKIHRLRTGESINGWNIKEIQNKEVLLARGNETRTLELLVKRSEVTSNVPQRRQRSRQLTGSPTTSSRQAQPVQAENINQPSVTEPPLRTVRGMTVPAQQIPHPTPEEIEALTQSHDNEATPPPTEGEN